MKLYTYYRSSAAYRVRIAMNLKGISYTPVSINLLEAQQKSPEYTAHNPQGLIPALELDDGTVIAQSTAILEYLEETRPETPLLPAEPLARARMRSVINHIACDIHPLNNIAILNYLKNELNAEQSEVDQWYSQWINRGFSSLEPLVAAGDGQFCMNGQVSMADCYLVPQVYNAIRFKVDISA